jgi:hypothetical protein
MDKTSDQFNAVRRSQKFSGEDSAYLEQRRKFAASVGFPDLFTYLDQFGLYAGAQTIATKIVAYEILKRTIDVPGHVMEFGVWHGSNLLLMAKLLRLLQPSTTKLVFGFDNFSGLPNAHELDGKDAAAAAGRYKGNEETLRAAIDLYELQEWVHLIKGDATQTIPAFERAFPEVLVSLAWIDFDLYEPCYAALKFLRSRIAIGGIIVFDEAISAAWPGETIALTQFLEETPNAHFRMVANTLCRQPVMYLVRES